MLILGIETSCDETAVAVVEAEGGLESLQFKLLGSAIQSQVKVHEPFGGVVPNLAKREHVKNLPIVLEEALKNAGKTMEDIEKIAVTVGPGLEPALWAGIKFAHELGQKLGVEVVPTNHLEGHLASVLLDQKVEFPGLALLVSGGHTELVFLQSWAEKKKIGETKDDAVGEAFDKVARMLGLPYPGGPGISALAEKARNSKHEIRNIKFPRPMIHSGDYNFSFSGLKTAVLYYIKKLEKLSSEDKKEIAKEFEEAVIETLITKTKKAIEEYQPKTLILGGGVAANKRLSEEFLKLKEEGRRVLIPQPTLTTDNATMIAIAGFIEYLINGKQEKELMADGNLSLGV